MSPNEWMIAGMGIFVLVCAVAVIFSRSPIYGAFGLVLCFFGMAGLFLAWSSPFLAMIQVLISTGAVVVLFVFVVMLLNLGHGSGGGVAGWVTVLFASGGIWTLSLVLLRALNRSPFYPAPSGAQGAGGLRAFSKLLFTDYLWPFEVLSVFLLAVVVATYVVARPEAGNVARKENR